MELIKDEKNPISFVDFPFICRICFVRGELRLFEEEKCLWDLFQSLMKTEVRSTVDFPKNVCSDCIDKLRDISLFIEISRYTALYFQINVFSMEIEDDQDNDSEKSRYCRSCLTTTHLSLYGEQNLLLQLFQEITGIDVPTSTDTKSFCYRCINELEKVSFSLNSSKRKNGILEILATVGVNKEVSNADDDESIVGRSELKVEINDYAIAGNETKILADCMYRSSESFMVKDEFQNLHTTLDIKDEILDNDHTIRTGSISTKPFGCNICDKRFTRKYGLRSHLRTHTGEKPFKCDNCDKRFALKSTLQRHSLTHTGEKSFKCDDCDKRFTQKTTLRSHLLTHTGEKSFECDYCNKKFARRDNMRSHLLTHTGEKPFKCDECDKRFTQKTHLRYHLLTHTGEKSFECDYCDKKFAHKNSMQFHLLTHTGEKPFKCDDCDKRFTQKTNLRSHLITHTGEKPFTCDYCDKRFAHKRSLRSHSLNHTEGSARR